MARCGGSSPPKTSASKKIVHASEQERPDVAAARAAWIAAQPDLDPARLVFIDETGTSTNMARLRGRAKRGRRVIGRVPWGHWKILTLLAGLRQDGITAPFVIDRAMTRAIFTEYLRQCLVPTLAPGDIVVMDNLPAHRAARCARSSRRPAPSCDTCRPIPPTSTRSSKPLPNSKLTSAKLRSARSIPCGSASANCSTSSNRTNAPTSLSIAATLELDRIPL